MNYQLYWKETKYEFFEIVPYGVMRFQCGACRSCSTTSLLWGCLPSETFRLPTYLWVRCGIAWAEEDIQIVGQAPNGKLALAAVLTNKPDVLITDIEMPEMTGLELANKVQSRKLAARVVILTTFARERYLRRAMSSGASGYILKDRPAKELADAVRRVHQGLRVIDAELAADA